VLKLHTDWPGTTVVLLDRPDIRNALDLAAVRELQDVVDGSSGTLVIASATPGMFCAGMDLRISDAERAHASDALYQLYESLVTRPGAVIAVVDGPAVGGGAQLAASADLRIASPSARFRWVGVGHGLAVGSWILPALVGRTVALELCLTTRWLPADEAVARGFIARLDDDPLQRAEEIAGTLATARPEAVGRVKRVTNSPGILAALRDERLGNLESWGGSAPSAAESAAVGRMSG
jgi:enoyl-CoA hydratase/carnithine racemase